MPTITAAGKGAEMVLDPRAVKDSFSVIEGAAEKVMPYFYGRLFAEDPALLMVFPTTTDIPPDRIFRGFARIIWSLESPENFAWHLRRLGYDHLKFGIRPEHYGAIGRALIAAVRRFAGDSWNATTEAAWRAAYDAATEILTMAAEDEAQHRPPWWTGEVVAHDRPTPDVAVITVRPHRPLRYEPGQYISVETSRWPRVWRRYSIANSPREDGTLDLHVRAIPAGWVSGALVHHTRVGDQIRLGPALGDMVADDSSGRDVLCVAGGTGLAPIKALVEQLTTAGHGRQTHLFFGARRESDLYDLAALRRLESPRQRLRVVPVVSHDSSYAGMQGMLPDVVARDRSWADHDVFVSGPAEMTSATVNRLQEVGVPLARIRHDPFGGPLVETYAPGDEA